MVKRRAGIVLTIFGVVLALVVGGAVFMLSQQAAAAGKEETLKAVVVVSSIGERSLIPTTAIGVVDAPKSVVPPNAVTQVEDAAGKMTLSDMYPGDWVLKDRIADTKGASGRSFTMEAGQVMMTFPTSDIIGAGAVKTGDYVDILVTIDTTKERDAASAPGQPANQGPVSPGGTTQMTMQNLKVLSQVGGGTPQAANGSSDPNQASASAEPKQLLLAVSRDEALILKQMKDYPGAKLELILRAAGDNRVYSTEAVNMRGLIERFKIKAPQTAAP